MENILSRLLLPDNETIKQATQELKAALKRPEAVAELCTVLTSSALVQNRQYAAILLKQKLSRRKLWQSLPLDAKTSLKTGCMQTLIQEAEKLVREALCRLVATLAKHEPWPELLIFLKNESMPSGANIALAMYLFSVLIELTPDAIVPHWKEFAASVNFGLKNDTDPTISFHAIQSMIHMVKHIGSEEANLFGRLLPDAIEACKRLISIDQDKGATSLELFEELFETDMPIMAPHLGSICEMCLAIAANSGLDDALRSKAIEWLSKFARVKRKTVVKKKLYMPMVNTLFPIVCSFNLEQDEDDDFDSSEHMASASVCAAHALDTLAVHLPPEKFMPTLLHHVKPALDSQDTNLLKGAFYCLAVCAEGCSENIKRKYLIDFLRYIDAGIKSDASMVRNAALYALGQFSEHLQPDISEYANNILPVLLMYLDSALALQVAHDKSVGHDRIFYALEIYCENLAEKLVPFLPELMRRLLMILNGSYPTRILELCISCIGSVADAVQDEIVPYFDNIIQPLKGHIMNRDEGEDATILLTQSLDSLGALARAVGPSGFAPSLAEECCKLALDLVENRDDPDIRKCAYALFGAVAFVVKERIGIVLANIVPRMLESVSSHEGISLQFQDQDSASPLVDLSADDEEQDISVNLDDDGDGEENDDSGVNAISVENAYMEEKERAIMALKEMCQHGGAAFEPYLMSSVEAIVKLLDFPDEDIRRESVEALAQFAIQFLKSQNQASFVELINILLPRLVSMVKEEEEAAVVSSALETIAELLKQCKSALTSISGTVDQIVRSVYLVMKSECACMDAEDHNENEEEAELDEYIYECAGEILPNLGRAMEPHAFHQHFVGLFPMLLKKTKKNCTPAEKSFGAGSIAECLESIRGYLSPYIEPLLCTFHTLLAEDDDDIRNNAVYGLGELCLHGGAEVEKHFPIILQRLDNLSRAEKAPRVRDQVVGAYCRMILANKGLVVPLDAVVAAIFQGLPLNEDMDEYATVFATIQVLYVDGNIHVINNLSKILMVALQALTCKGCSTRDKVDPIVNAIVRQMCRDFPAQFNEVVSGLNEPQRQVLMSNTNQAESSGAR